MVLFAVMFCTVSLWAAEGKMEKPDILEITLIALIGGLLGVFFMVPLRNALIVREHGTLPYPEGTACAEVLLAGEEGGANASTVFAGMGFAAIFKFIIDGLKAVTGEISLKFKGFAGEIGTQIYPAVMSVGYICGARISSYMFAGGVLSWLVIIPLIVLFGTDITLYPGTAPISEMYATGGASAIWSSYIRYIGAGALAAGILPKSLQDALGIALYGMFIAIIIPAAKHSKPIVMTLIIAIGISCVLEYIPVFSHISSGFAVIIVTLIAAGNFPASLSAKIARQVKNNHTLAVATANANCEPASIATNASTDSIPSIFMVSQPQPACMHAPTDQMPIAQRKPFFVPIQSTNLPAKSMQTA